jgi:hypothetical protein
MDAWNSLCGMWSYLLLYVLFGMQTTHATSQLLSATQPGSAYTGYLHCATGAVYDFDRLICGMAVKHLMISGKF